MSNVEQELVFRGTLKDFKTFASHHDAVIYNQFERHEKLPEGMITNRCRKTVYPATGAMEFSTATKYTFSNKDQAKKAVEIEKEISNNEFEIIANMCNEHIIKNRYTFKPQTEDGDIVIELDVFFDFSQGCFSEGFKIDIENSEGVSQEWLSDYLASQGLEIETWLSPDEWGDLYNSKVREYKN